MDIIGTGVYSLPLAARLVGEDARALRRWVLGYSRKYKGEQVQSEPLWTHQLANANLPGDVIGFRDLLELRMVSAFVRHGVSLKVIRATLGAATQLFGQGYPLTDQRFLTDGKRIFLQAVADASDASPMLDVLGRQFVFSDIIKPSLYAGIEYGQDGAVRWYPLRKKKTIVLDPALQFGTPVIADAGVPTDTIYAAYLAEGQDKAMVARVFDISPELVNDAVEFEQKLAA